MKKAYLICYRPIDYIGEIIVHANSLKEAKAIFEKELAHCGAFLYSHVDSQWLTIQKEKSTDNAVEYNNPSNSGDSSLMLFLRQDRDMQDEERGLPPVPYRSPPAT